MGQTIPVKVKVGMLSHPMIEEHFIQSIELFAGDKSLGKVELNPKENTTAEAEFNVALSKGLKLRAIAYCNIHGMWESVRNI